MQEKLIKYFWILNLVTLLLVAYFTAIGVSELMAAEFDSMLTEADDQEPARPRRRSQRSRMPSDDRDGMPILQRNIFDSITGPIDPTTTDLENFDDLAVDPDDLPVVECKDADNVQIQVLATVVSETSPDWSFASLSTKSESRLYRIGDEIENRTLSGITWKYVFLRGDRDECYIDLFGEQKKAKKRPRGGKRLSRRDIKEGIQVVSPNERVVDRALLDQALASPAKFARSVRVRPYKKNGKVNGFRIRRMKKNSPLSMLGAKKGDIFHSVNGVELTSVDKALSVYQNLRNESEMVFQITRKGRPTELKISVH